MLDSVGVECTVVGKGANRNGQSAVSHIENGKVDLVINVPIEFDELGRPDGYHIRRRAIDTNTPLITDRQLARALVDALIATRNGSLSVTAWNDYLAKDSSHRYATHLL